MLSNEQVISIATNLLRFDEFKLAVLADTEGTKWLEDFRSDLDYVQLASIALMMHTGENFCELSSDDYLVLDISEVESRMLEYAESYYYNMIEPEIPPYIRYYFNKDEWVTDYASEIDSGEALSTDGTETQYTILDNSFYIYKI